ncbi:MAG TPA: TetR/AcrR family transcriptional regulator [Solirubrobacterales bacterium]
MSSCTTRRAHPPEAERRQIFAALVEVSLRDGYRLATVETVSRAAGIARTDFERHFRDLEDCFTAYLLEARDEFFKAIGEALLGTSEWREQIRAASYAMLRFWREDEARARMLLIETFSAGPRAQLVKDEGMEVMFDLIDQGRSAMPNPGLLTRATAEAVGGAVFNQMRISLERDELDRGEEIMQQLMYTVVLPYRGTEAALEELSPPPAEAG